MDVEFSDLGLVKIKAELTVPGFSNLLARLEIVGPEQLGHSRIP